MSRDDTRIVGSALRRGICEHLLHGLNERIERSHMMNETLAARSRLESRARGRQALDPRMNVQDLQLVSPENEG
jgi:hypothetical protein